jgi:hypothetical protein
MVFLTVNGADASFEGQPLQVSGELKLPAQGAVSMHKKISYRVLTLGLRVGLGFMLSAGVAQAQRFNPTTPTEADIYCSGLITDKPVPDNLYVISGEDSRYRTTFQEGEAIFINTGAEQGVKVGDQFDVVRPMSSLMEKDPWFKYQNMLSRAMGTRYADIGRLRIKHVDAKTSTGELSVSCDPVQRGDIVRPFAARPAPQFHDIKLDPYAPPSGKKTGMIVTAKDYTIIAAPGRIVYINLGNDQGIRVGDYYRVFRYEGTRIEAVAQVPNTSYKAFGFGSTPVAYEWNNLPRQVLGEGIVLRTGPNSSTVILTTVREEIFAGDYVEVE